ncbi:MAG: hypothetical protein U9R79_16640 [Armatimonadota bacterium]|nr:hypothetical protein [Armatimonadota bacterium]
MQDYLRTGLLSYFLLRGMLSMCALEAGAHLLLGRLWRRAVYCGPRKLPHRQEIEWGARWVWAVMGGAGLLIMALTAAAVAWTPYPLTATLLGYVLYLYRYVVLGVDFPWHFVAISAIPRVDLSWQFVSISATPRWQDLPDFVERYESKLKSSRARWSNLVGVAVLSGVTVLIGSHLAVIDRRAYRVDRSVALSQELRQVAALAEGQHVHVELQGSWVDAERNEVTIWIREPASDGELAAVVARVERLMAEVLPEGAWYVEASVDGELRLTDVVWIEHAPAGEMC